MSLASLIASASVVERDDHDDRPEDLLLRDPHGVARAVENGRLDIESAGLGQSPFSAVSDPGALLHAEADIAEHPLHVALLDQGAELRAGVERMAERDFAFCTAAIFSTSASRIEAWASTREPAWQVSP